MTNSRRYLPYGVRGEERKRLVKAVAEYRECISEYCGAPTFDYVIEDITIDKSGTLIFSVEPDEDDRNGLIEYLASRGFYLPGDTISCEEVEAEQVHEPDASDANLLSEEKTTETIQEPEEREELISPIRTGKGNRLTIELPKDGFSETALDNLQKLVDSKASLLKKSLGTEDLSIEITEDKIKFPWFSASADPMEVSAYTHLIAAIGKMAKSAKRVTAKDRPVESEKYSFRTWLLRLGFVGAEYKQERIILMKNLSGYAAFKNQENADAFYEKLKVKKKAKRADAENMNGEDTSGAENR